MKVSVFGLGYVGLVTAACLADRGHSVIGVDIDATKTQLVNDGKSPIIEEQIGEILARVVRNGSLIATLDASAAVRESEISLVCVGTPSRPNGDLDTTFIRRVCQQIGAALQEKKSYHSVVIRSTVLPGTTETVLLPAIERSSCKKVGEDFEIFVNPEFLREGSSVRDFYNPPYTLVGAREDGDFEPLRELYHFLDCEFVVKHIRTVELLKYVNNSYHGLKVAFANEVGRLCAALDLDSHSVMEIFCKDTKQNLSSYYLKPGYAFGGSCLPKDLRAILYKAKTLDVALDILEATLESNRKQMDIGVKLVELAGNRRVGILGLSFKAGVDDLRESPLVSLVETLLGKGYQIKIFDSNVSLSRLVGANKAYVESEVPHIGELLSDSLEATVSASDTIVIGNSDSQFATILPSIPENKTVIDLVRIVRDLNRPPAGYRGISWSQPRELWSTEQGAEIKFEERQP